MKRKNIISLFLLSAGCMLPLCASAQHVYSLDECIEAALDNNVRMKNAQNNLRMAEHSKQEAFSKYFPTVSAMGSGFLADKSLVRMGLSPEMQMAFMKNGLVGDVSATLPLFTGGQIVNGNKLAKVNVEVNRLQQRQSQNEVTLTVENYFWQVVMLKEKLQTISTLDKQLTQLLQDVETSVQAGVTTRNDLLQVQLRQNEIQSKRIQAENMLSLSRSMLAQYIGHPADSIEVAATLKDTLPQGPEGLYTPPEAALATTNEYNLLQQNVKASSLQHKMAIGKNLPTIAIGGGYAYENLLGKDHTFWLGFVPETVVTGKHIDLSIVNIDCMRTDGVEEVTVVAHNKHRMFKVGKIFFQPCHCLHIQIIGRFVEKEVIRISVQCLR